jgi:hypothetical protein
MIFGRRLPNICAKSRSTERFFSDMIGDLESMSQRRDDSMNLEKDMIYSLKHTNLIEGHATSHGTFYYTQRNPKSVP